MGSDWSMRTLSFVTVRSRYKRQLIQLKMSKKWPTWSGMEDPRPIFSCKRFSYDENALNLTCLRQPGSIFEFGRLIIAARDRPRGDTKRGPVQATHSSLNPHFSSQVPVQSISSPRFCTKSIFSLTSSLSHELPRPQRGETRTPYFCRALWHQLARRRW